jgi:hypothetical protein
LRASSVAFFRAVFIRTLWRLLRQSRNADRKVGRFLMASRAAMATVAGLISRGRASLFAA